MPGRACASRCSISSSSRAASVPRAQQASLRRYLQGLLDDSPRKSMQAMLALVTHPEHYQTYQHFSTHATWDWQPVGGADCLELLPVREGMLVIDETSFPKQGTHSVSVARSTAGALGKIANRQVATTALLWARYLDPGRGTVSAERVDARPRALPARLRSADGPLSGRWRLALTLVRRARAAGLTFTAVLADAAYGDVTVFREVLHRLKQRNREAL